jgi:hypothetical protein
MHPREPRGPPAQDQSPEDTEIPPRRNTEIISRLQTVTRPDLFTQLAVYDGKRILFSPKDVRRFYQFGDSRITFAAAQTQGWCGNSASGPSE